MQISAMKAMSREKYQHMGRHMLFWVIYSLYLSFTGGWDQTDQLNFWLAPQLFMCIPVTMIVVYVNLYLLMPAWYYPRKYKKYACSLIITLLAGALLMRGLTHIFILPWEQVYMPERYLREKKTFWIPVRLLRMAIELYPIVAITTLLELMYKAYLQEKHLRELEKEKHSAEMAMLKAQINPHFFFNTLNSLYALTLKGSDLASKVVLRLSHLMRYMLYDAGAEKVLLTEDLGHIENYINIEQMRFADRLDLSFQYSGDINGKMIAPLLLLPFIENAFKHGVEEEAGWITINLKVTGHRLFLKVENSYPKLISIKGNGLGLKNVKRRLELTYPERYSLQLTQHDESFEAELKLDL